MTTDEQELSDLMRHLGTQDLICNPDCRKQVGFSPMTWWRIAMAVWDIAAIVVAWWGNRKRPI